MEAFSPPGWRRPTTGDQQGRPSDEAQQAVGAPVDEELRLLVVPARVRMRLKTSQRKSAAWINLIAVSAQTHMRKSQKVPPPLRAPSPTERYWRSHVVRSICQRYEWDSDTSARCISSGMRMPEETHIELTISTL